jgi:hypothetical protein
MSPSLKDIMNKELVCYPVLDKIEAKIETKHFFFIFFLN